MQSRPSAHLQHHERAIDRAHRLLVKPARTFRRPSRRLQLIVAALTGERVWLPVALRRLYAGLVRADLEVVNEAGGAVRVIVLRLHGQPVCFLFRRRVSGAIHHRFGEFLIRAHGRQRNQPTSKQ